MLLPSLCLLSVSFFLPSLADPVHLPIARRSLADEPDYAAIADSIRTKYGYAAAGSPVRPRMQRRQSVAGVQIIDQNLDASYFAAVDIGTPPQTLQVILDTGSADLWVADTGCDTCTASTPLFDITDSSTAQTASGEGSEVTIRYGSGQVTGTLTSDLVSMGGFSIPEQSFLSVDRTSVGLLSGSVSGIMGLAFDRISSSRVPPWWQTLATTGQLAAPELSFWLDRFRGNPSASAEEPGGIFTIGGRNESLFTGEVEFLDLVADTPSFWLLRLASITVGGESVSITGGNRALSAIDTGTTLVGGPGEDIASFWSMVPGSEISSNVPGLYTFPCDTELVVTMSFGGLSWPIDIQDMNLGPEFRGAQNCLGGFFDLAAGSSIEENTGAPGWVVGATFLKNVYSVFRASDPPAIGFAQLSDLVGGSASPSPGPPPRNGDDTSTGSDITDGNGTRTISVSISLLASAVLASFMLA